MKITKESGTQTFLILDNSEIVETFEALCNIPFVPTSSHDMEPPTKREKGIEQLIEQLTPMYIAITEVYTNR